MAGNTLPIRYAPSGPALRNDAGAPAVPGRGAVLRSETRLGQTVGFALSGAAQSVEISGGSFLEALLPLPQPGLSYRARCSLPIGTTAPGTQAVNAQFAWSVNAGASFAPTGLELGLLGVSGETIATRWAWESTQIQGAALPGGVVAGTASLICRVQLIGSADAELIAGLTASLVLEELF